MTIHWNFTTFPFSSICPSPTWTNSAVPCASFQPARRCIYDASSLKYLVQTRDDVEAGDEKIKELESEMKECGLYDSDFSLGDLLDEGEEESATTQPTKKKNWMTTLQLKEMRHWLNTLASYKRACLNKKAMLKSTKERLEKDNVNVAEYKLLGCKKCSLYHAHFVIELTERVSSMFLIDWRNWNFRKDFDALASIGGTLKLINL